MMHSMILASFLFRTCEKLFTLQSLMYILELIKRRLITRAFIEKLCHCVGIFEKVGYWFEIYPKWSKLRDKNNFLRLGFSNCSLWIHACQCVCAFVRSSVTTYLLKAEKYFKWCMKIILFSNFWPKMVNTTSPRI